MMRQGQAASRTPVPVRHARRAHVVPHVLGEAMRGVRRVLGRGPLDRIPGGRDRPGIAASVFRALIDRALDARGGDLAARGRAEAFAHTYANASDAEKRTCLLILAEGYGTSTGTADGRTRDAARVTLFRRLTTVRGSFRCLLDLRADVRRFRREEPALEILDTELKSLLEGWFDLGLLELRRIDWETSASILERLAETEAVHDVQGWTDLKHRLGVDRRVFALFHPRLPNDPLIAVSVALVKGLPDHVQALLDEAGPPLDPELADTAAFYSISSTEPGLAGIPFGNFLLKRATAALQEELPRLRTFATLSPMPGFRAWLEAGMKNASLHAALGPDAVRLASSLAPEPLAKDHLLERLAAYYLLRARGKGGRALDPVAHFHLANGARVERLNLHADQSEKGMEQSLGVMVNYLYDPGTIEANADAYTAGEIAAAGRVQRVLARRATGERADHEGSPR